MWRVAILYLCCLLSPFALAFEPIRLAFPQLPPYQFLNDGQPDGTALHSVVQALNTLELEFELVSVPNYGRALKELEMGHVDGFFVATRNAERDALAEFSAPVAINRWAWFFPEGAQPDVHSEQFKSEARVGTLLHTNTHHWLVAQGYERLYPLLEIGHLPKMLSLSRLDAVFLAEATFKEELMRAGWSEPPFQSKIEIEKPLGIYIGRAYLSRNPGLMTRLNKVLLEQDAPELE